MKFIKSTINTFITNILIFGIAIFTTSVTSWFLGPDGKGVLGVSNNTISFSLIFLGLGIASSNVYFIGKEKNNLNNILGINIIVTLFSIVPLLLLYVLNYYFHFGFLKGITNSIMIVILFIVPVMNLKSSLINFILGMQEVGIYNKINFADNLVTFILMVIFIMIFKSPFWVIVSNLVASILIVIITMLIFKRKYNFKAGFKISLFKEMLGYGLKSQLSNIATVLNYRLDTFIINSFLTIGQVGIYSNAVALGETMWQVSRTIATIIFPMTSNSKDKMEMKDFINKVTRITFTCIIICSIIIIALSRPFIIWWFGMAFVKSADALIWLIPGISIFSISNILANYLAGIGKVEKNIIASFVSCVITVILDLILIPRIGINGASIATSISYIVATFITLYFYIQITSSRLTDILLIKKEDLFEIRSIILRFVLKKGASER